MNSPPGKFRGLTLNFVSFLFFPVSCVDLDGDAGTMPIIFEDVYKDDEQANEHSKRRRHSFSKYNTLLIAKILSVKNVRAWVSMIFTQNE